ncbi:hypothetical protein CWE13_10175 [Aliidiomarina shirensis]|uniref:Copper chaperone PCu(A)C n=1 Tax=Aliidiomarina shirensis TaxID=1048642 RepID=A0A432WR11_9GAMM|nr:copper chaperone PCu(A)C [Aliidiomarina shirensis]RUO36223.1 hypothetical protein CWE13_10175 [Aliidiomarina shirensis]
MRRILHITIISLCIALLAVVSPAFAEVEVESLWLRESIPGQPNGAGFGTLRNSGEEDVLLVAASSSIAGDIQIHQHVREGEQMRMEQMDALVVPAGESVSLRPGGYHLMLMELIGPLVIDEQHEIILIFSNGNEITVTAPVKALVTNHHGGH